MSNSLFCSVISVISSVRHPYSGFGAINSTLGLKTRILTFPRCYLTVQSFWWPGAYDSQSRDQRIFMEAWRYHGVSVWKYVAIRIKP